LQQFLRIAKPVLHTIGVRTQGLRGQQTGRQGAALGRVCCHEENFIDSNIRACQRGFQLLSQDRRLRVIRWESAHQAFEVLPSDFRGELNAGEASRRKQLRKAAFGGRGINGHAIEQELRAGSAQQHAGFIRDGNGRVQFVPGGVELLGRARVVKTVEPRVLEQDVQATDESARGVVLGVE
jgi:hypothetical protein